MTKYLKKAETTEKKTEKPSKSRRGGSFDSKWNEQFFIFALCWKKCSIPHITSDSISLRGDEIFFFSFNHNSTYKNFFLISANALKIYCITTYERIHQPIWSKKIFLTIPSRSTLNLVAMEYYWTLFSYIIIKYIVFVLLIQRK